jgi:hypothetical protein
MRVNKKEKKIMGTNEHLERDQRRQKNGLATKKNTFFKAASRFCAFSYEEFASLFFMTRSPSRQSIRSAK